MFTFVAAQIIGALGMVIEPFSYQFRKKRNLLICDLLCSTLCAIHFWMLGAASGCLIQLVVIVRTVCIFLKDKKGREWNILFWILITLHALVGIVTFDAWYSILSVIASLIYFVIVWKFKDTQKVRYGSIPSKILWVIYGACVWSIPAVIVNICNLISIGIGIARHRKPKKN